MAESSFQDDRDSSVLYANLSTTSEVIQKYRLRKAYGYREEENNDPWELAHYIFLQLLDYKLVLAPINKDIKRALDVGTGAGTWAYAFAYQNPSVEVIATDISLAQLVPRAPDFQLMFRNGADNSSTPDSMPPNPQSEVEDGADNLPTSGSTPPNLKFDVEDAEDTWDYPDNYFDLVHVRLLSMEVADWPGFYRNALRTLQPGGWIDQLEFSYQFRSDDGTLTDEHVLSTWSKTCIEAGEKSGKTFRIAELAKGYMEQAGFQNVTERQFKVPIGPWTGSKDSRLQDLGNWNLMNWMDIILRFTKPILIHIMGWGFTEAEAFLSHVLAGLRDSRVHSYIYVVAVYGQKPTG